MTAGETGFLGQWATTFGESLQETRFLKLRI